MYDKIYDLIVDYNRGDLNTSECVDKIIEAFEEQTNETPVINDNKDLIPLNEKEWITETHTINYSKLKEIQQEFVNSIIPKEKTDETPTMRWDEYDFNIPFDIHLKPNANPNKHKKTFMDRIRNIDRHMRMLFSID